MILLGSSVEDTDRSTCTNSGAPAEDFRHLIGAQSRIRVTFSQRIHLTGAGNSIGRRQVPGV